MTVRQLIHVLMEMDLDAQICLMTSNKDQDNRRHQFGISGVNTVPSFNTEDNTKHYYIQFENRDFITKKEVNENGCKKH